MVQFLAEFIMLTKCECQKCECFKSIILKWNKGIFEYPSVVYIRVSDLLWLSSLFAVLSAVFMLSYLHFLACHTICRVG